MSSDAVSTFGQANKVENDKEVELACFELANYIIPTFAYNISRTGIDTNSLVTSLHREGINCR